MYRTRAFRRHHTWRIKEKIRRKMKDWDWPGYVDRIWRPDLTFFQRDVSTTEAELVGLEYSCHMKRCSCTMCGNSRRHFGERTVQERKADLYDPQTNPLYWERVGGMLYDESRWELWEDDYQIINDLLNVEITEEVDILKVPIEDHLLCSKTFSAPTSF